MNTRTIYILVLVLVSSAIAAVSGCNIGDLVQVKTPTSVQQSEGLPGKMTLNDSLVEYQAWLEDIQRSGQQWRENIETGEQVVQVINGVTMQALDTVGPTLMGIPVLGPSLPLLFGLGGLFLRRPGDVKAGDVQAEKEGSYAKGKSDALALMKAASSIKARVNDSV